MDVKEIIRRTALFALTMLGLATGLSLLLIPWKDWNSVLVGAGIFCAGVADYVLRLVRIPHAPSKR